MRLKDATTFSQEFDDEADCTNCKERKRILVAKEHMVTSLQEDLSAT